MTYQIWRGVTIFTNPPILVSFDHLHQASEGNTFTMKEFDCIMLGQLDNPSSSVDSYLSDDNDKQDLQQTLIEESRQKSFESHKVNAIKTNATKVSTQNQKKFRSSVIKTNQP